jgi:peptidoglycan/LPS O-acetylase OafA/YrhL
MPLVGRGIEPMSEAQATTPDRLADAPGRHRNNFDLLRLIAASFVVLAHSFDLLNLPEPFPHVAEGSWGNLGVLIFFAISGYLVCQSWSRSPRLLPFVVKRALRLMPALLVALLLTALVLGPLATTAPIHVYLESPLTKAYVLNNALMQSNYTLPGVFTHTVYPGAVNGSLWTLPLEVKAYVFIAIAGLVGLLARRRIVLPVFTVLSVLACVYAVRRAVPVSNHVVASLIDIQLNPALVDDLRAGGFNLYPDMFATFAIGATLYSFRRFVPLRWEFAALGALMIVIGGLIGGQGAELAAVVLGPYLVLCFAFLTAGRVRLPARMGDYSYGLYVYAFPVQQTISQVVNPHSGWVMFLLAMPITVVLAIASWHFVERPALGLKARLTPAAPPAGPPTEPSPALIGAEA